jgi:hypothetical protein
MLQQPFDVTCKIHELFKYCTYKRLRKQDQDLYKPLQLGESWDPLIVTQGLLANKYNITVSNMNNEKVEEYNDGIVVNRAARGNTAEKKRQISDQEDGTTRKQPKDRRQQKKRNKMSNKISATAQRITSALTIEAQVKSCLCAMTCQRTSWNISLKNNQNTTL